MKIIFNHWAAVALAAVIAPFGLAASADEPSTEASDAEVLFPVLQRDDDGPRRGPEARPRGPEDRRPDGDRLPPGARGRGPGDRGPGDRRPGGRGDLGGDRPRVGPPGGAPPGARRGGPGPQSLDARIARLEQKLDTVLRELRSLRSDRPPLAMMSQRSPAGPPQFGMRGRPGNNDGPRPPMGPPPYARRGGDGDRIGPPPGMRTMRGAPGDDDGPRPRRIGPPDAPRGGMRSGGPPRDDDRQGENRPSGGRRGGPPPRSSDRDRDPDLTF